MIVLDRIGMRSPYSGKQPAEPKERLPKSPKTEGWQKWAVQYKRLAYWCVRRFFHNTPEKELEDHYGEALRVLVRAARHYDPAYRTPDGQPVQFKTYASAAIFRHLTELCKKRKEKAERMPFKPLTDDDDGKPVWDSLFGQPSTADDFDLKDQLAVWMRRAQLRPKWKRILRLLFWESRTLEEVAALYGCTKECIRQHRDRALGRLREAAALVMNEDKLCA